MAADRQLDQYLKSVIDPMLKEDGDKVLLLSCIDLRFPNRIIDTMDGLGYRGKYYHLAMAGASHAARHNAEWTATFEQHLDFAVAEGHVKGVIILDHMDCKAYELYENVPPNSEEERLRHIEVASSVAIAVVERHPTLAGYVHAYLMPKELTEEIAHA
ncbi:carbonic anhydrase [Paludisphaera soli]|uniref:carbonic anhydrase n=1 Tax=Paludisphaera soli TaxID=2712865 RepID=UPI0013EA4089|nr:carbonic anhydrase [Paludisphaera soli]